MCVIDPALYEHTGKVRDVAATRLLVAPVKKSGGSRQLTVYSNRVALEKGTKAVAMILPVPNPGNEPHNIRVVDTSDDAGDESRLFSALHSLVRKPLPPTNSSRGMIPKAGSRQVPLPIERCGSYAFTIVPSILDFRRVHSDMLPREPSRPVMKLLRKTYDERSFSFLVCKIAAGADAQYHPLAYTHPVLRPGTLFVPTLHYHGDEDNDGGGNEIARLLRHQRIQESAATSPRELYSLYHNVHQDEDADFEVPEAEHLPHWDHEIYMFGVSPQGRFGRRALLCTTQNELDSVLTNVVPRSYTRAALDFHQPQETFRFRRMLGKRFENRDVLLRMAPQEEGGERQQQRVPKRLPSPQVTLRHDRDEHATQYQQKNMCLLS